MQSPPVLPSVLRPDAFKLLSALDAYDLTCARMLESWFDMHAYADFARQIDAIREHGVSAPELTVLSLQLVIAHSELVSTLWQDSCVRVNASRMQEVRERHSIAINALRAAAARPLRVEG